MTACVYFITTNANKLREVRAFLEPEIQVLSHSIELEEVQGSIEEVIFSKCRRAADIVNGPVLVEDTALCYKALGDLPGVYIKWFLAAIGLDGLNKLLSGFSDKTAEAVCTFGYSAGTGMKPIIFQGRCRGKVVPARGHNNFGWDPIFEHHGKTFAEMAPAEKNRVSHRAEALLKLQQWFKEHQ